VTDVRKLLVALTDFFVIASGDQHAANCAPSGEEIPAAPSCRDEHDLTAQSRQPDGGGPLNLGGADYFEVIVRHAHRSAREVKIWKRLGGDASR